MSPVGPLAGMASLRRRIAALFDDGRPPSRAAQVLAIGLAALIVVNVTGVILESVASIHARHATGLWWLEHVATAVFAVEYVGRVWTAIDLAGARNRHPLWGRLRYAISFFALVDLVAVLPAILGLIGAADLRTLRLLRLLRLLKLTRHATVFNLLWGVFREEARAIAAILFIMLMTLTISASLMYMIEGEAQPDQFASIPAAMWWAIETLTTVGYGDVVPVTPFGKLMGGVVSIVGIVALALFTGLITVSFMDQLRVRRVAVRQTSLGTHANAARHLDGIAPTGSHASDDDVCPKCGHRLGRRATS